jgi:hypothetical protein
MNKLKKEDISWDEASNKIIFENYNLYRKLADDMEKRRFKNE